MKPDAGWTIDRSRGDRAMQQTETVVLATLTLALPIFIQLFSIDIFLCSTVGWWTDFAAARATRSDSVALRKRHG